MSGSPKFLTWITCKKISLRFRIISLAFTKSRILALSRAYEQATSWFSRRPPLHPDTQVPPVAVERDSR
jgi:hypothetical protein